MVGKDALNVLSVDDHENFDVIARIWDYKLVFRSVAADLLIRTAIDALLEDISA